MQHNDSYQNCWNHSAKGRKKKFPKSWKETTWLKMTPKGTEKQRK